MPVGPLLKVLAQDGINPRIVRASLDDLVLAQHAFGLEAAFFQHALRRPVTGRDKGLDAVEIQRGESVRHQSGDGFASVSLIPVVAVQRVSQFGAAMRRRPTDEAYRA